MIVQYPPHDQSAAQRGLGLAIRLLVMAAIVMIGASVVRDVTDAMKHAVGTAAPAAVAVTVATR